MFNSLRGEITGRDGERLFLRTGGLEWEIWTCGESFSRGQGRVRIYTYVHHREDQLRIYGFASETGRRLFLDLIKVAGVGPRLVLKIMSGIGVEEFIAAVEDENLPLLEQIPGLGRKTAQKIVLSLRGKLISAAADDERHEEIVAALVGMGFDKREARRVITAAAQEMKLRDVRDAEYERDLLKMAIRKMGQIGSL